MIKANKAITALRSSIDAIIFDIDGVLLDVTDSIRVANCLAVPLYLREVLHWPAPDDLVTSEDIEAFKHAGGFNDDTELTRAIVLHFIVKEHENPGATPETLNVFRPSLADFARKIGEKGGGLKVAETICLEKLSREHRDAILLEYRTKSIDRVFLELFGGEYTKELYGYEPQFYHGPAYVNKDKPLIDVSLIPSDRKVGALTGRSPEEAALAMRMCEMTATIPQENIMTPKDAPRKPHPGGLLKLVQTFEAKHPLFIGDTLDDFRTVERYRRQYKDDSMLSALVLTGPAGVRNRKIYERSGADIVCDDVNELLTWLTAPEE